MNSDQIGYRKIVAWQKADEYAQAVYGLTLGFPKHELYGIVSQLRRACLSVPLNIVEGYARNNKKEFRNFLRISFGSLAEADYLLQFCLKRKYVIQSDYEKLFMLKEVCAKLTWKMMKSMY